MVLVIVVHAGAGAQVARKAFSHYEPILERRPFGTRLPQAEPPPPAPVAAPAFSRTLRMVAIRDSAAGLRVGIVDISVTPPKVYYLYVGEPADDGLTVVAADFERETAVVRKDGVQDEISMRGIAANGVVPDAPSAAPAQVQPESGSTALSYAERRRQRIETMRARLQEAPPPEAPADPESLDRQLQEYQMRLIREGKTPLPIPLSPEADAQLVAEGVLPP